MPKKGSLRERLRKAGIRSYDVLIHDQPKEWLIKNFKQGATVYSVNVARLMRNIVWQAKERIAKGEKPPLKELLRTFWYMYIKPTLSRAAALTHETDQYAQMIDNIVYMVKDIQVMKYEDIGFRDEGQAHRKVGANANIILFSEKLGHQDFLSDIANKYNVSILALGGQPSVLTSEYFVDTVRDRGVNLQRSFYLFSIVDYDPSGWIIRDAFINNLKFYGITHTRVIDLITPDMLTPEEIKLARYQIPESEAMRVKNKDWLKEVHKRDYRNQKYLEDTKRGKSILYGLEAESISAKRLEAKLTDVMVPLLGKSEDLLKIYELREIDDAIKALIIHKLT
ncbi:MAG: hypothetical protein L6300_02810 [Syntrophaceae bacterium]|nr:hypothetical protein [Candidatus Omnitrophota bacterium]MCG2739153.1 hypothetical protein [Syntrophaceae bacterium]